MEATLHSTKTLGWSRKHCNGCTKLLTEVKKGLEKVTDFTEHVLNVVVQDLCDKYKRHHILEEVCDYFGEGIIHELFKFIEEEEKKIDVQGGCERIRLCPRQLH